MWLRQLNGFFWRAVDWLASTYGVLAVIGAALSALAITTATNPTLNDLPGQQLVVAACCFGAGAALTAIVRMGGPHGGHQMPSKHARQLIGVALMIGSAVRAVAFGLRNLHDVGYSLDWFGRTNPIVVSLLTFYFGFIIWARAHTAAHVQSREGKRERMETPRDEGSRRRGGPRDLHRLRRDQDLHGQGPAHHDVVDGYLILRQRGGCR